MKIIKIIAFSLLFLSATFANSDARWMSFNYDMSFAAPKLHDYIDKPSFQGFSFNFNNAITPYITLGGRFAWNNFYEKRDRQSYNFVKDGVGGTITGVIYRRVAGMQTVFQTTFVGRNSSILLPYLTVGLGASWDSKEQLIGIWSSYDNTVHFIVRPEIGLIIPFNGVGINISGGFNGIVNNSNRDVNDISNYTVSIGFTFGQFDD